MPLSWPSWLSRSSKRRGRQLLAVDRDRIAALEVDGDHRRLVRRVLGRDRALVDIFGRLDRRILEHLPLGRRVQKVGVDREGRLAALVLGDRDLVLLGEVDQRLAAGELPFAPRRDDPDVRLQRVIAELEADLVVALAGRAVTDRVRADLPARSRSAAWRSAAGRSTCRANIALRKQCSRGTSGRRSRGRTPRAGPR